MKETDGSSELSAEVMTKSTVWFLSRVGKLTRSAMLKEDRRDRKW